MTIETVGFVIMRKGCVRVSRKAKKVRPSFFDCYRITTLLRDRDMRKRTGLQSNSTNYPHSEIVICGACPLPGFQVIRRLSRLQLKER